MLTLQTFKRMLPGRAAPLLAGALLAAALAACDANPNPTPTPIVAPPLSVTPTQPAAQATATEQPRFVTATPAPPTATPTIEPSATPTSSPTEAPLPTFTWQSLGFEAGTSIRDIALLPQGKNIVLFASPLGVWRTEYDYKQQNKLSVTIPGNPPPGNVEAAIGSPEVMYVTAHTACASGLPITSFRSSDGGQTWSAMPVELLDVHAAGATTAYGTTCSGVLKSTDGGASWSGVLPGSEGDGSDPYVLAGSPDGQQIYAAYASEGGITTIKRSTDGGQTWANVTPKNAPPDGLLRAAVHMVFVPGSLGRPDDAGLYLANQQGTYFLPTESDEWQVNIDPANAVDAPEYYVTAFYVDTAFSDDYVKPGPVLYEARARLGDQAFEGIGVFRSTNLGKSWQRIGDDIGKRAVQSLVLAPHDPTADPAMQETLLAGTADGAWAIYLPTLK